MATSIACCSPSMRAIEVASATESARGPLRALPAPQLIDRWNDTSPSSSAAAGLPVCGAPLLRGSPIHPQEHELRHVVVIAPTDICVESTCFALDIDHVPFVGVFGPFAIGDFFPFLRHGFRFKRGTKRAAAGAVFVAFPLAILFRVAIERVTYIHRAIRIHFVDVQHVSHTQRPHPSVGCRKYPGKRIAQEESIPRPRRWFARIISNVTGRTLGTGGGT